MSTLRDRIEAAYDLLRSQLAQASTIRGLLIVAGSGSTLAGWIDPDRFPLVMLVVGVVAVLLPDDLPWSGRS